MTSLSAQCCISGGGPAGLMMGYLLARQGVDVIVLEKHADFLRDFRGDTVHPSTLEVFHELGLLDELLSRPHQKTRKATVMIAGKPYAVADFNRLPTRCKYIAMMPQWDFLDLLADAAELYPNFRLLRRTRAERLLERDGRIVGVKANGPQGAVSVTAALTVAADGRNSVLRDASRLQRIDHGAPIDVFWMRLPRQENSADETLAEVDAGGFLVMINRGDYWQCALPVPKGSADLIRAQGIDAFRERIVRIAPNLKDAVGALQSWDDVKLLNVQVNRLKTWWRDGFLCIGDAAHAMSPIGGVGINLAIQDAVAAARILGPSLRVGDVAPRQLAAVQKRRNWPARIIQWVQVQAHARVLIPAISATEGFKAPWPLKLLNAAPWLQGLPARAIGMGPRPEHWRGD